MNVKPLFTICLGVFLTINSVIAQTSKSSDINAFWTQFKAAVIKKDKNAVANMTKFPLSMPFGQKSVRSKAELLRRYKQVFDGETDAAKCFEKAVPEKGDNENRYGVYCGFRNALDDETINRFIIILKKQKPAGNLPVWIISMSKSLEANLGAALSRKPYFLTIDLEIQRYLQILTFYAFDFHNQISAVAFCGSLKTCAEISG